MTDAQQKLIERYRRGQRLSEDPQLNRLLRLAVEKVIPVKDRIPAVPDLDEWSEAAFVARQVLRLAMSRDIGPLVVG